MTPPTAPFVLLDDARPGGETRLYRHAVETIAAAGHADIPAALDRVRAARNRGLHAAGFLTYTTGASLLSIADAPAAAGPLLWFGLFERWETVDPAIVLPDPAGAWIGAAVPEIDQHTYAEQVRAILALIAAGDVSQANLSLPCAVPVAGDPLAIYALLRRRAGAGYGAVIATGDETRIVDLMRDDLSRVAVPGRDAVDVLAAIEGRSRGVYTDWIGRIDAGGDAAFDVAIRTLSIRDRAATLALGTDIVADSDPAAKWAECLAKARVLGDGPPGFALIETMAFDPNDGIVLLDRHMVRMRASAARLGFAFDRHTARNELQAATFRLREPRRVRLMLSASGAFAVETSSLPAPFAGPATVAIMPSPVPSGDLRLHHKTSARGFYDAARRAAGTDEVVFEQDGFLTEGSFTTLFVPQGHDGVLVTPPLQHGLLPGVLRQELIATGRAVEGPVRRADLSGGFLIGNAVRGLLPATLVATAK